MPCLPDSRLRFRGFTLVEIMLVVVIIGVLASFAIPAFMKVRQQSYASAIANNFRVYRSEFEMFVMEEGYWPPDATPSVVPLGMEGRLNRFWEDTTEGDFWDWERNAVGVSAGVSLQGDRTTPAVMERVDEILDDGDLSTGEFFKNGNRYTWRFE